MQPSGPTSCHPCSLLVLPQLGQGDPPALPLDRDFCSCNPVFWGLLQGFSAVSPPGCRAVLMVGVLLYSRIPTPVPILSPLSDSWASARLLMWKASSSGTWVH